MSVLVINEPFVPDFCRTQRWAARTRGRVLRAPDWLAYATAVLEEAGIPVHLFDFPALGWDKAELRRLVADRQPQYVVLDSTTPSIYSDIECARLCKEAADCMVIFVGPHASALPEETLTLADGAVDVVAIGEYDYTIRDIVLNSHRLGEVPGICWRDGEAGPQRTAPREPIEDLDALPFPAWHHLNLMQYFDGGKLYPYIDIISGRGCPNGCTFCLWPQVMHGYRYRFRSPENVVDEIQRDIHLCPEVLRGGEFFFEDDTFTVNQQRAITICEEILRRSLKITISVNARVDSADLEMFKAMKRAGCRELLVGFESGNQQILDRVRKGITVEQSRRFMELARQAGLDVHGCFVFGLPGETMETIQQTMDFALGLGLHTVQFSGAVPFPGTRYYQHCEEEGWLVASSWKDWLAEGEQAGVVRYPGMSQQVINEAVDRGLRRFYFRPSYMVNFALRNRNWTDLYRKVRGAKHFFDYLRTARSRS